MHPRMYVTYTKNSTTLVALLSLRVEKYIKSVIQWLLISYIIKVINIQESENVFDLFKRFH